MSKLIVEFRITDRTDGVEMTYVKRTVDHLWEGLQDVLNDPHLELLVIRRIKEKNAGRIFPEDVQRKVLHGKAIKEIIEERKNE